MIASDFSVLQTIFISPLFFGTGMIGKGQRDRSAGAEGDAGYCKS